MTNEEEELRRRLKEMGVTPAPSGLISRHHVGVYLDLHQNTLRKLRDAGVGPPAVKMGGQWFYSVAALAQWLANGGDK